MADSVYGLAGLHPGWNWHDGNPFDLGWILFYSCWGAAALHPSMRELSEPRPVTARQHEPGTAHFARPRSPSSPRSSCLSRRRLGKPVDATVIAVVAGVMFLLVRPAHGRRGPRPPAGRGPGAGPAPGGGRTGGCAWPRASIHDATDQRRQ